MNCSINFPPFPVTCDGCGHTPYIGENGNWYVEDVDTGVKAQGPAGKNADSSELARLSNGLEQMNTAISGTAAKILKYASLSISSGATQDDINRILGKLDNPTTMFGDEYCIYLIKLDDQKGAFMGGYSYILGYTYGEDTYGAQLVLNYSGLMVRYKRLNIWTTMERLNG